MAAMSGEEEQRPERVYYLENEGGRFWEVKVTGNSTVIRFGKVGCKGRTCASKLHKTAARGRQWAVRQTNAKRMEGYLEPVERAAHPTLKRRITSLQAERVSLRLSKQPTITLPAEQPTITLPTAGPSPNLPGGTNKPKQTSVKRWRKPHKKQSTIRILAKQASVNERLKSGITRSGTGSMKERTGQRLHTERTLSLRRRRGKE